MVQIQSLLRQTGYVFINLFSQPDLRNIVDITVLTFIIYNILKYVAHTRANALIRGIILVLVLAWLSSVFELVAIRWVIQQLVSIGLLVLVIVFQPEMRRALNRIGRTRSGLSLLDFTRKRRNPEGRRAIEEIFAAAQSMSRKRIGALIVFECGAGLHDVIETGTLIDAKISAALIENIFEPKTPLHDGALILVGERMVSAACILPLSDNQEISRELGTRHRAAIGITENTDAVALVVSEETGTISMAKGGKIRRYLDDDKLRGMLTELFDPQPAAETADPLGGKRIGGLKNAFAGRHKEADDE